MSKETNVFLRDNELVLCPIEKDDAPFLARIVNDQEVTQYINTYLPARIADEEAWVAGLSERRGRNVVLLMAIENEYLTRLGTIGLHDIHWRDRTAVLGISIGNKNYWGKGYGTRAVRLLVEYAFRTLNLRKVVLSVIDTNTRAYSCYKKCGFYEEGRQKEQVFRNGRYRDLVHMAVFADDWPE